MEIGKRPSLTHNTRAKFTHIHCALGIGCHARRRAIINRTLARDDLFEDLMRESNRRFDTLVDNLQSDMQGTIETQLGVVQTTLDLIRSDIVASESEQNPEFRGRVGIQVGIAHDEIRRIQQVVHF